MKLNDHLININRLPERWLGVGAKIAKPYEGKIDPDSRFRGNPYSNVFHCSDRHGHSEGILREAESSK